MHTSSLGAQKSSRRTFRFRGMWCRCESLACALFAAAGANAEDIHDSALRTRTGEYDQYHHGDINAFHVWYFRRALPLGGRFTPATCARVMGPHLVARGADPIPDADEAAAGCRISVVKCGAEITLWINDLQVLGWHDDGESYGPTPGGGKLGFRQMAPPIAEYGTSRFARWSEQSRDGHLRSRRRCPRS